MEQATNVRKVLQSIGILTVERLLQLVCGAAVSILLARTLGPGTFGLYAFVLSSVALVAPLVEVGQSILVRDLVADPSRTKRLLATAARVAFVIGALLQFVAIAFALYLPAQLAEARGALVIAASVLLIRPFLVIDYWFQSRLDARRAASARLAGLLVGSALRIAIAVAGGSHVLPLLAATTVLEAAVMVALMYLFFRRHEFEPVGVLTRATVWRYFQRISPLLIAGLSVALYMRLDMVMLGLLSDADQVGQYAAAVRFSEFTYFIPLVFMTSIAPGLVALYERDEQAFRAVYDRVISGLAALSIVLVITFYALAPLLISLAFGDAFQDASGILRVHVLSLPFVFLGVSQTTWTAVYEQQGLSMWRTVGGAVINAVLNVILIPDFGALGASYATVVAYAFAAVAGNALSRRTRPFLAIQLRQLSPWHVARNLMELRREVMDRLSGPT